ncbi:MAG: hypothetical protein JW843_03035, partial [Candidatus Aminicenantes bacterium]|nr:hypothetical protein [Candidatus Aminicenantes bacterium]
MRISKHLVSALIVLLCGAAFLEAQGITLEGEWVLVPQASAEIDLYGALSVGITIGKDGVSVTRTFGGSRSFKETWELKTGGAANLVPVLDRVFPTNVFMGVSLSPGEKRTIQAYWEDAPRRLRLEETGEVLVSQGKVPVQSRHVFQAG